MRLCNEDDAEGSFGNSCRDILVVVVFPRILLLLQFNATSTKLKANLTLGTTTNARGNILIYQTSSSRSESPFRGFELSISIQQQRRKKI